MDAVHHRERLHDCAGVEVVDLQAAAAHVVDLGDIVLRHVVEDVVSAPGALHLQRDGLCAGDLRHGDGRRAGDSRTFEEFAAAGSRSELVGHFSYPPLRIVIFKNGIRSVFFEARDFSSGPGNP